MCVSDADGVEDLSVDIPMSSLLYPVLQVVSNFGLFLSFQCVQSSFHSCGWWRHVELKSFSIDSTDEIGHFLSVELGDLYKSNFTR